MADPTTARRPRKTAKPIPSSPIPSSKDSDMTTTDTVKATFTEATKHAETAFAKGQEMFGELGEFSKGNLEAMVESSTIAAKGFEALGKDTAAYVKNSVEEAQSQARALAGVGSPTEFLKLQGDFGRTAFDRMVAETSRSAEAMLKLVGEIAQPISNRVALAAEKAKLAA